MGIKLLKELYIEVTELERNSEMLTSTLIHAYYWACINYFARIERFTQEKVVSILNKEGLCEFIKTHTSLLNFDSKMNVNTDEYEEFESLESFIKYIKTKNGKTEK